MEDWGKKNSLAWWSCKSCFRHKRCDECPWQLYGNSCSDHIIRVTELLISRVNSLVEYLRGQQSWILFKHYYCVVHFYHIRQYLKALSEHIVLCEPLASIFVWVFQSGWGAWLLSVVMHFIEAKCIFSVFGKMFLLIFWQTILKAVVAKAMYFCHEWDMNLYR